MAKQANFANLCHMNTQGDLFKIFHISKFHTVAIWTFTFHKKSSFVMVILKANFKPTHKPVSWTFWTENKDLLYSFPSIFGRSFQIHCFWLTVAAISMLWHIYVAIWYKNVTRTFQAVRNSSNCVQKAVDLTTPAKNRRKMGIINLNFQIKKFMILACALVWNLPSKSPLQSLIFCEM